MNGIVWKLKFTVYMLYILGTWVRPRDYKFAWSCAEAHAENIDYEYSEYTPKECVLEEISYWYE